MARVTRLTVIIMGRRENKLNVLVTLHVVRRSHAISKRIISYPAGTLAIDECCVCEARLQGSAYVILKSDATLGLALCVLDDPVLMFAVLLG